MRFVPIWPSYRRFVVAVLLATAALHLVEAKKHTGDKAEVKEPASNEVFKDEDGSRASDAAALFHKLDKNKDGKVTLEEYQQAAFDGEEQDQEGEGEQEDQDDEAEGEEEEEEEGKEIGEMVNIAVACTLLGGVAFVMGIFYMVNHDDDEMRLYSWQVVSCTVSIFVANLVFHAFQSFTTVVADSFEDHEGPKFSVHIGAQIMLALFCVSVLHAVIARISWKKPEEVPHMHSLGALLHGTSGPKRNTQRGLVESPNAEPEAESRMQHFQQQMQCWATLMAHICGFAAMHTGAMLQERFLDYMKLEGGQHYSRSLALRMAAFSFIPTLVLTFVLFCKFRFTDQVRSVWLYKRFPEVERIYSVWDETTEEAENDIGALAISYLLVQSILCAVTGQYPGEEDGPCPEDWMVIVLGALAFFFAFTRMAMVKCQWFSMDEHEATIDMSWSLYFRRWAYLVQAVTSMTFAWCLLATSKALVTYCLCLMDLPKYGYGPSGASVRAVLAMLISILAFVIIFMLDTIGDRLREGGSAEDVERGVRGIIRSLGILVGFAWEQAFAGGMENIIEKEEEVVKNPWFPVSMQVALAIVVGLGVVPAWEWYILRNLMKLQLELKMEEENEKAGSMHEQVPFKPLAPVSD